MNIFNIDFRKDLKNRIVNNLFHLYKKYKSEKYTDELLGFIIKSTHLHIPNYCLLIIIFAPMNLAIYTFMCILFVMLLYIYLDGCFLSSLEYKIDNKRVTIADPYIVLCNDIINYKNRILYTIIFIILYVLLSIIIIYLRFFMK